MKNLSGIGKERMKSTCSALSCEECKASEYCNIVLGGYALCESVDMLNEVQENTFYELLFNEDKRECDFKEEENDKEENDKEDLV